MEERHHDDQDIIAQEIELPKRKVDQGTHMLADVGTHMSAVASSRATDVVQSAVKDTRLADYS